MYSWDNVAERTEKVYSRIMATPKTRLSERFIKYNQCGLFAGKLAVMIVACDYLMYLFMEWFWPRSRIDRSPTFDRDTFVQYCENIKS